MGDGGHLFEAGCLLTNFIAFRVGGYLRFGHLF